MHTFMVADHRYRSRANPASAQVSPAAIASELRQHVPLHGGSLECVVLNACSSGFELGSLGEMLYQVHPIYM